MARTTKGRIYKRGKFYWLDYSVNGERLRERLNDAEGNPATNAKAAKIAADTVLRPYTAKDALSRRRLAADALKVAEEVAADAEEAAREKLAIANMWELHPYTKNTRGSTERKLSPGTVNDNFSQWSKFVEWTEETGVKFAEDVTTDHATQFRESLTSEDGLSADRVNKVTGLCAVMFRLSGIDTTPFDGFRKLAHKPQGRRELTDSELRDVCGAAAGEMRTLLAIGLYTGLRLGDATRLEWEEIAPDLSKIVRLPSKLAYRNTELVIPIHPVLSAILSETPQGSRKGFVLPETGEKYGEDKTAVSRAIQRHLELCGIRLHRKGTGGKTGKRASVEVGFHSLRHSFVSICARQGVPLHVVQALCGHSTPAVQRLYLHHSTEDTSRAIASLPSINGDVDPEERKDRERLAEYAKTLPIEKVRSLLAEVEK